MNNTKKLVLTAVMTALIFVTVAYILHIPIFTGGYVHIGDALIYLAACLLPMPYAIFAGVVGAGLVDAIYAPVYIISTIIAKALAVLFFTSKQDKIICTKNVLGTVFAGIVSVITYSITDVVLYLGSDFTKIWSVILINTIQPAISLVVFVIIAFALDKMNFKQNVLK